MMLLVLMIGAAMAMVEENATEEWGSRSPSGNCHCEQTQVGGIHGHSSASFCAFCAREAGAGAGAGGRSAWRPDHRGTSLQDCM